MQKRSSARHVLAGIRKRCGLTQRALAKLLSVATISVKRIEQCTLSLSEDLATKAQTELDVSAAWLLANNPKQPAVTSRGGLWSKELYEFTQGSAFIAFEKKPDGTEQHHYRFGGFVHKGATDQFINWLAADYGAQVHAMLEGTRNTAKQGILVHRLRKLFASLQEDFKPDPATLDRYAARVKKLEKDYWAAAHAIYVKESDELS